MESILSLPRGEAAVLLGKGNSVHWLRTARIPQTHRERSEPPNAPGEPEIDDRIVTEDDPETAPDSQSPLATESGVEVRDVLLAIARFARQAGGEAPVRVSLEELRREVDPTGRAVRVAGGILGRSGALVRTSRDERGPCWWIDPARMLVVDRPGHGQDEETGAEPPQPS